MRQTQSDCIAMIAGAGSRLGPAYRRVAKPALPFGESAVIDASSTPIPTL